MNEVEIAHILNTDSRTRSKFLGILAADELHQVQVTNFPAFLIANTGQRKSGGHHWVCLFFEGRHCEYFDPLGQEPPSIFIPTLTRFSESYIYLTKAIQKSDTNTCGLFCLDFAYARCSGITFDFYIQQFNFENLDWNEWDIYYKWCVSRKFKASVC